MKSKAVTYSLLAVVVLIWGGIFVKVFTTLGSSSDKGVVVRRKATLPEEVAENRQAVYTIRANYRDPFLGSVASPVALKKTAAVALKRAEKIQKKNTPVDVSFVRYFGLIRNAASQKKIGMISIHDQEFMISEGEVVSGVTCLKHYRDSTIISFQGKRACIKK